MGIDHSAVLFVGVKENDSRLDLTKLSGITQEDVDNDDVHSILENHESGIVLYCSNYLSKGEWLIGFLIAESYDEIKTLDSSVIKNKIEIAEQKFTEIFDVFPELYLFDAVF